MHHHCEIILPPTTDIEEAIESILEPFDENNEENAKHSFWDWYQIGGRWSGRKMEAGLDPKQLEAFNEWLTAEEITVSGIQWGKQELSPASQIPKVDAKWMEMFPNSTNHCPLFQHSGKSINGDIQKLGDLSPSLACSRVIIAAPSYDEGNHDGPLEATYMISDQMWNGVTWLDTKWDGLVTSAIEASNRRLTGYKPEYIERSMPQPDWLVVTIDYHS